MGKQLGNKEHVLLLLIHCIHSLLLSHRELLKLREVQKQASFPLNFD